MRAWRSKSKAKVKQLFKNCLSFDLILVPIQLIPSLLVFLNLYLL